MKERNLAIIELKKIIEFIFEGFVYEDRSLKKCVRRMKPLFQINGIWSQ